MDEKEVKAIAFDVGGLLTNSNKDLVRKGIASKYDLDERALLNEILKRHSDFLIGKIAYSDYMKEISEAFNITDSIEFSKHWEDLLEQNFTVNQDLLELIKDLSKKYLICSLSNVTPFFEKIRIKKRVYENIKIRFSSFEKGLKKPNPEFFNVFLEENNLKPENCIFIDDLDKNLIPAKEIGMNTILFKDNEQLIRDLKNLGVKI